jgi:hypothetical protein
MSVLLDDIVEAAEHNMGGLQEEVYGAYASDIAVWPTLPNLTGTQEQQAVLVGNFVMKPGKSFKRIRTTLDTGGVRSEEQGETDGISYKHMMKFFKSGMNKKDIGYLSVTKNTGMVFVAPNANGVKLICGSKAFPARRQPGGFTDTTETTAGRNGSEVTFFSYGNTPAPIYEGTIPGIDDSGSGS